MSLSPGETVGPYRVIEQLGSGGMATVFKAYHPALDRYVALKILHPAFKADPQFFERFSREARIVANLEHPHIIPVYDFNEHNGEPYLVMRYVEGDTLKARMDDGPLASDQVLSLMEPVCRALAYAHRQGVLHRDIKPSNIMVTPDGSVFLTDFGLARMVQAGESTLSQDMMVGTPQYISPEQAQGLSELDGRTDIYSLGVVLFEMLTGQVPFNADTPFATVHDHIYTPLPLPSQINPDIDPAAERLLLKALAKEPEDRFDSAEALLTALETTLIPHIEAVSTVTLTPDIPLANEQTPAKNGLPWWVWAGGTLLILCILGTLLAGLLFFRGRNRPAAYPQGEPTAGPIVDQNSGDPANEPTAEPTNEPQPDQATDLTRQANQALRQGQPEAAIESFNQAIAADPHHLPAYFGLSEALRQQGDQSGSLAVLEEAVAQNPDQVEARLRLGQNQLFGTDDPAAALATFEEATRLAPDTALSHAGQALALLRLERPEEAKAAIDTALGLNADSPEAHLAQAIYLREQGDRLAAGQELRQVVSNPQAPGIVKETARRLLRQLQN